MIAEIIITSLVCVGVKITTQFSNWEQFDDNPEMFRGKHTPPHRFILWWLRWYGSYLPKTLRKPLYQCLPCMASLWSVPAILVYSVPIIEIPLMIIAVAGLNGLISFNLNTAAE